MEKEIHLEELTVCEVCDHVVLKKHTDINGVCEPCQDRAWDGD